MNLKKTSKTDHPKKENTLLHFFKIDSNFAQARSPQKRLLCCQLLRKPHFLGTILLCGFVLNTNKFLPVF